MRSITSVILLCFACGQVNAHEISQWQPAYSQMNHGGVGLIQMPTARFNQDGTLSVNYQDSEEYRFWTTSLQLFPWMETTIRYTDVRTKLYSDDPGFSGNQTYKDKGIDTKFRLLAETDIYRKSLLVSEILVALVYLKVNTLLLVKDGKISMCIWAWGGAI